MSILHLLLIAVLSALVVAGFVLLVLRKRKLSRAAPQLTVTTISPGFAGKLASLFKRGNVDTAFFAELEETLVQADVGIELTAELLESVRGEPTCEAVREKLAQRMREILAKPAPVRAKTSHVILVLGVNGVGKTTTIAKLARAEKAAGRKVLLVAGDTFRAAAVEQLTTWSERLGCEIVAQGAGADSAAVAFDGVAKAVAKQFDTVIIDTAGRLHTKHNLMEELKKVVRVIGKASDGAPHERLIVIDATVGSNGLVQAKQFHETAGLTGAIVTKLDGSARGGIVLSIARELDIPITHIGVGEGMDDLKPFDADVFVKAILG